MTQSSDISAKRKRVMENDNQGHFGERIARQKCYFWVLVCMRVKVLVSSRIPLKRLIFISDKCVSASMCCGEYTSRPGCSTDRSDTKEKGEKQVENSDTKKTPWNRSDEEAKTKQKNRNRQLRRPEKTKHRKLLWIIIIQVKCRMRHILASIL